MITLRATPPILSAAKPSLICSSFRRPETSWSSFRRPWFGVFAPAATPRAVVDKIRRDIAAVLAEPEFREREITGKGYTGVGSTPDEFAAFVRGDLETKGKLIRVSGAKAE